jgi:hypothetical protein
MLILRATALECQQYKEAFRKKNIAIERKVASFKCAAHSGKPSILLPIGWARPIEGGALPRAVGCRRGRIMEG